MSLAARLTSRALDLAFPAQCVGCGREGAPVCEACLPALDARLATPPGILLGLPGDLPRGILQLEWCAPFGGVVRAALHHLKYAGERRLAEPLGTAMARRWSVAGAGGDVLVPVPVHHDRAARRGYDQAVLLATVAARELGLPMLPALERWQATTAQYELDRRSRSTNVDGAFRLRDPRMTSRLAGRWVVLIDDVMTTGATLSACASALEAANVLGVSAITLARER